jgi:hypothetical protein
MSGVSFAATSYNEGEALGRMVRSSLPFASLISEWVIMDHRSDDDTQCVLEGLRPVLYEKGIHLRTLYERRDLSPEFTMADLRNKVADACASQVVVQADADFVFGPSFLALVQSALPHVLTGDYHTAGYAVPVVWDHLKTSGKGRLTDHGRVWVHKAKPSIYRKDLVHFRQVGGDGHWETLWPRDGSKRRFYRLTPPRIPARDSVVSINVKPAERLDLRATMTTFMQDCVRGQASGGWLENYSAGNVRRRKPYKFVNINLRGWKINAPKLRLGYDG